MIKCSFVANNVLCERSCPKITTIAKELPAQQTKVLMTLASPRWDIHLAHHPKQPIDGASYVEKWKEFINYVRRRVNECHR